MRHRKAGRKLGMNSTMRKALFRNMVTSLMLHGQILTTEARAKELRRVAERLVTIAKRGQGTSSDNAALRVHAIRRARRVLMSDDAVGLLFATYAPRFAARNGGYTRIVKAGFRGGDNAPMAVVQMLADDATEASAAE